MNIFLFTSVPLIPPWDQGDKNFAYTLAKALPDIQFTTLTTRNKHNSLLVNNIKSLPLYKSAKPSFIEKVLIYLRLVSLGKFSSNDLSAPDIYHMIYRPFSLSSNLLKLVPELRRKPTIHTMPASADKHKLKADQFFASRIVVNSEYGQHKLTQLGLDNVTHIPPGIEIDQWESLSEIPKTMKTLLGISGQPTILFPGHYGEGQGSDILLAALPRIIEQVPDVCVLLACRLRSKEDVSREAKFKQTVIELGISHAVRYYNTIPDMKQMIGACDLVVLPLRSMRDKVDIPTTLLEALAAGKPMVISDIPPMNEIVKNINWNTVKEVGITVPPSDPNAFAKAIIEILLDSRRRHEMGLNGQQLIRNQYDINNVARIYEGLYKEMVA